MLACQALREDEPDDPEGDGGEAEAARRVRDSMVSFLSVGQLTRCERAAGVERDADRREAEDEDDPAR